MMAGLVGPLLIIFGFVYIYDKDIMWKWTEISHDRQGLVSRHTPDWDKTMTVSGIILIVTGIACMLSLLSS